MATVRYVMLFSPKTDEVFLDNSSASADDRAHCPSNSNEVRGASWENQFWIQFQQCDIPMTFSRSFLIETPAKILFLI